MDRSSFLKRLKTEFPQLRETVNQEQGLLHFEVNVFRQFTQRAIYAGEQGIVDKCFALALEMYEHGNAKLKNAVDVSFIEPMDFSPDGKIDRSWAWQSLPKPLKALFVTFHGREPF